MTIRTLTVFSIFFGGAIASQAAMQFINVGAGQGVNITYNGNGRSVFAGKLNFLDTISNTNFQTVCGDLDHTIGGGQTWNYNAVAASSFSANMGGAGNIVAATFNSATSVDDCTALQLAVWEAVYDAGTNFSPTPDFAGGVFQASSVASSILTQASTYYATINTPGTAIYFNPDPTDAGQGQLAPVPEPATMAALGLGAAALIRRRKRS